MKEYLQRSAGAILMIAPARRSKQEEAELSSSVSSSSGFDRNNHNVGVDDEEASDDNDKHMMPRIQQLQRSSSSSLAHHLPYSSTIEALKQYHAIHHGHLVLPYRYMVPDNAGYPNEWVGYDLAGTVYNMKWWLLNVRDRSERVNELNDLGFVWGRLQPKWNLVIEALVHYLMLYKNIQVPYGFVVPSNSTTTAVAPQPEWPKAVWSLPLGHIVSRIRRRGDFVRGSFKRRQQLDRMGFVWDCGDAKFGEFYNVLRYYLSQLHPQERYNNHNTSYNSPTNGLAILQIPRTYIVPTNDKRWPCAYWGYPLGQRTHEIIHFQSYIKNHPERVELLRELGLHPNRKPNDLKWFQVCHAAAIYLKLQPQQRCLEVPVQFCVPHQSDDWPEQLWGLPLGRRLQSIRLKGTYLTGPDGISRRQQLDALRFVWSDVDRQEEQFQQFLRALTIYKELYQTVMVPHKFIVPYDDANWPAELGGYRLGFRAGRVRNEHIFIDGVPERQNILRNLGFRMTPMRSDGGIALTARNVQVS